jgi:hypothetical protein
VWHLSVLIVMAVKQVKQEIISDLKVFVLTMLSGTISSLAEYGATALNAYAGNITTKKYRERNWIQLGIFHAMRVIC